MVCTKLQKNTQKEGESMETITFFINRELKKKFQIMVLKENTNMTEKLIEMIKEYLNK